MPTIERECPKDGLTEEIWGVLRRINTEIHLHEGYTALVGREINLTVESWDGLKAAAGHYLHLADEILSGVEK